MIDVSSELANLNAVNIAWRIPCDNNAPITDYILDLCDITPSDTCIDNNTVTVPIGDPNLNEVNSTHLSYLYGPSPPRKTKEVVIRAQNGVGHRARWALYRAFVVIVFAKARV